MAFWRTTTSPQEVKAEIALAYARYGQPLFKRARSLLGNDEDAHEIVQEIFCIFWRDRKKFRGESSVFTFLYRMTTNRSIDLIRRRARRGTPAILDEQKVGGPGKSSVDTLDELAFLTEGLDEETLTVAVLAHVDGLTQDEIAESIGRSRRTIGKKLKAFVAHTQKRKEQGERVDDRVE